MKLFGYTIIKTDKLKAIETNIDKLIDHVDNYGGFVNEKGLFISDGRNKTIEQHWDTYNKLIISIGKDLK